MVPVVVGPEVQITGRVPCMHALLCMVRASQICCERTETIRVEAVIVFICAVATCAVNGMYFSIGSYCTLVW